MVISIIIVLLGLVSLVSLPISQYPSIVPPKIQVTTTFVGASATDVEAAVATPLEQKINGDTSDPRPVQTHDAIGHVFPAA